MKRALQLIALLGAAALFAVVATPAVGFSGDGQTTDQTPDIDPEIQNLLDRGDELAAEGHWGAARRQYKVAADRMRRQGVLPSRVMRRIANSYYYEDRYQSAGKVLEQLAEEAADFGELHCEVWALADAAWVAGVAGDKIDMERRLARLDRLLTSPFLPDAVRDEVVDKRLAGVAVAARRLAAGIPYEP